MKIATIKLSEVLGDFDKYAKDAKRTGKLRKEYGISDDVFLIGTVSYFYKPKYHMLQSFQRRRIK